jgi:dihydrofolate reductase
MCFRSNKRGKFEMKKIIVGTFLTLDGVMQAPGDPQEDTEGGFKHGGWQMSYFDADAGSIMGETIGATDALLLGRVTYQIFAALWAHAPEEDPMAQKLNSVTMYIVSTTLDKVEWGKWDKPTLIKGDLAEEIARLKKQPGKNIGVGGSPTLVHSLIQDDLLDELTLMVHPIIVGSGKRLFTDGSDLKRRKLVDSKTTSTGVEILTYQPEMN